MVILMISSSLLKGPAAVIFMFPSTLLHLALYFSMYSGKLCRMLYMYILGSVISATGFVHLQVCISLTISELQDLHS